MKSHLKLNHISKKRLCRGDLHELHDLASVRVCESTTIEFTDYKSRGEYCTNHISEIAITSSSLQFELSTFNKFADSRVFKMLGFSVYSDTGKLCRIDKVVKNRQISIELITNRTYNLPFLDDIGFTCIAFLTTNIKNDSNKLIALECTTETPIIELIINDRKRLIWFGRLPGGAIIELIQIRRT